MYPWLLGSVCTGLAGYYIIKNRKQLLYDVGVSSLYSLHKYKMFDWFNPISSNIYIGALPLRDLNHHNILPRKGIQTVISLVEKFELNDDNFLTPVQRSDWVQKGIRCEHIETPDFTPLSIEKLNYTAQLINDEVQRDRIIYVHCKAGRGRSAMAVIAYYMKFHHLSAQQAIQHVKNRRPTINMNSSQKNMLLDYEFHLKNQNQNN